MAGIREADTPTIFSAFGSAKHGVATRMNVYPTQLRLANKHTVAIRWSDGAERFCEIVELREKCPCAVCNAARRSAASESTPPVAVPPGLTISHMAPVGNYAYCIHFSDGHTTGIYSFDLLQTLGREEGVGGENADSG